MASSRYDALIGQNVTAFRGSRSQQSLADAMRARGHRWSQATVWGVEKGKRPISLAEAVDLAEILGIQIHELTLPTTEAFMSAEIERRIRLLADRSIQLEDAAVSYTSCAVALRQIIADYKQESGDARHDWVFSDEGGFYDSAEKVVLSERMEAAWRRWDPKQGHQAAESELMDDGEHQETP